MLEVQLDSVEEVVTEESYPDEALLLLFPPLPVADSLSYDARQNDSACPFFPPVTMNLCNKATRHTALALD